MLDIDIDSFEHFSFDLWMTIIKSNPEFKPKRAELFKSHFSIDKDIIDISETIKYYDRLYTTISEKTGRHIFREDIFLVILDALGVDIKQISEVDLTIFFKKSDNLFLQYLPNLLWKDIEYLLHEIRVKGKTANILSNTAFIHGSSLRIALESLGLTKYFSFMIFSDEVGISKPNMKIYELMYEKVVAEKAIEKAEIIHIGDNVVADYNAALEYGIQSKLIKFD